MTPSQPDEIFAHPRLAAVYDALDPGRDDLDAYLAIAREYGARDVLDIGCGTGVFALLLAREGMAVTGLEPARASLDVARGKPGAGSVRWIDGDARALRDATPPVVVDLVTMTANVAQAIDDPDDWAATLDAARAVLRDTGRLVFETRDPARHAWLDWTPGRSRTSAEIAGIGRVESWHDLVSVNLPLVTFRSTVRFPDAELVSTSTLRFRDRPEVEADLRAHGFVVEAVRGAPDRPGREFVFLARPDVGGAG